MDCLLILQKEKCNRITLVSIIDLSGILYPDSQTGHQIGVKCIVSLGCISLLKSSSSPV